MTFSNEIQQTKEDIALLQEKLKKLEELEIQKSKSPVEKAFKEVYGYYPGGCERSVWIAFQKGYEVAHKNTIENNKNFEPTPPITNRFFEGNPPDGCSSWSEFFEKFIRTGNLRGLKISSLNNKVEEPKPRTLYDALDKLEKPMFIDDICKVVEKWLPGCKKGVGLPEYHLGWNDALRTIKDKLR